MKNIVLITIGIIIQISGFAQNKIIPIVQYQPSTFKIAIDNVVNYPESFEYYEMMDNEIYINSFDYGKREDAKTRKKFSGKFLKGYFTNPHPVFIVALVQNERYFPEIYTEIVDDSVNYYFNGEKYSSLEPIIKSKYKTILTYTENLLGEFSHSLYFTKNSSLFNFDTVDSAIDFLKNDYYFTSFIQPEDTLTVLNMFIDLIIDEGFDISRKDLIDSIFDYLSSNSATQSRLIMEHPNYEKAELYGQNLYPILAEHCGEAITNRVVKLLQLYKMKSEKAYDYIYKQCFYNSAVFIDEPSKFEKIKQLIINT